MTYVVHHKNMSCYEEADFIKVLLILQVTLASSEIATSGLTSQKVSLLDGCITNPYILCEKELVAVGVCLTSLSDNSDVAVFGLCPYITAHTMENQPHGYFYHVTFNISTLTEQTCGPLSRKGLLCSECYEGYGPAVYAFGNECVKCHGSVYSRWALYLFVVLLPITLFYVIVIIFNIHAASPPLTAFVLYCQIFMIIDRIQMPTRSRYTSEYHSPTLLLLARTLSGIWSLDIGRHVIPPFCVSESLDSFHALLLDYITVFYPMLLIFITYAFIKLHSHNFKLLVFLWKPFHRCFAKFRRTWDPQASIMNAFATFLFLSFTKVLFISYYSIQTNNITIMNSTVTIDYEDRLYYNPSINVNSHRHLPFIILSYTLSTCFVYIPTIFLCCYPIKYFKRALFCCCAKRKLEVDMLMDTFQGYYKDGADGTYDWRFLSGLYPLLMIAIYPTLNKKSDTTHRNIALCFIVTGVFSLVRPYKKSIHNTTDILLLLVTTFIVAYATRSKTIQRVNYFQDDAEHAVSIFILLLIPHLTLVLVIVYKAKQLLRRHFHSQYSNRLMLKYEWFEKIWHKFTNITAGKGKQTTDERFVTYGTF